jgi:hypothetical protein
MAEQEKKAGSKIIGIGITLLILLVLAVVIMWVTR